MTSVYIFDPVEKSKLAAKSKMAAILSINDIPYLKFTIVLAFSVLKEFKSYSKHVREVPTIAFWKFSRVHIEDVIQNGVQNVLKGAKWPLYQLI